MIIKTSIKILYIYCLLLENNKYYVGRINDCDKRFNEH